AFWRAWMVPLELTGLSPFVAPGSTQVRLGAPKGASQDLRREHDRDADIASDARRIERHGFAVAAYVQIGAGRSELQVAQRHLVEKFRQARISQPDFARERVEFQTERSFKQRERRGARPRLRRAGHRIERRSMTALALKTAKQFGQSPLIHVSGGAE